VFGGILFLQECVAIKAFVERLETAQLLLLFTRRENTHEKKTHTLSCRGHNCQEKKYQRPQSTSWNLPNTVSSRQL